MLTETTLCMGCMNDKTYGGPCKLCGYSDDDPFIPTYLAPKTFLKNRYIVGKLLSYNGEGANYIGYDKEEGVKVVIKEYMPDALCARKKNETAIEVSPNNSPLYKTYMSEFEDLNRTIMKMDNTVHIQAVKDVFSENGTCYAVMEHINGISLKTYLANSTGEMTWDQVKELFPPLFTTLSVAHRQGMIHRGLSPQTIYVTDKMELKLSGFCISAARTTNTEIACEIWSGYAAPEQYTNDEMNGTWTDVYGIAAVLYRVLTGSAPSDAGSGAAVSPEPMLINRNVPENVSKVIMRGMAHSPSQRIRDIGDFVSRLFAPPKFTPSEASDKTASDKKAGANVSAKSQKRLKKQRKERRKTIFVLVLTGITLAVFAVALKLAIDGKLTSFVPGREEDESSVSSQTSTETSDMVVSATAGDGAEESGESETEQPAPESAASEAASSAPPAEPDLVKVPDFTDRNFDSTVTKYEGLFTFVPTYDYSESHRAGMMYDQSEEPDTFVEQGAKINVKVSKGSSVVPLPEYVGKKGSDYVQQLTSLNIKYSIKEIEDSTKKGYVVKCSKKAGDIIKVREGETVTVYVSLGI